MGFMAFNAVLGPIARQIGVAEWQVGVIVTASGVLWMLSSRPWGHLGDRLGAHRVMQYGLMGYSLSFLLLVIIVMGSLAQWWTALAAFVLLLVVRSTVSLFYSGLPTMTQAYVAQTTTRETRAAGMATLGMGSALGLIFGPASAALLARWSLALPVVFSASVGVLAWWLVAKHLPTLAQSDAVRYWTAAVAAADRIPYDEPPVWFYPVRESLGAALLKGGKAADAEKVFREDLVKNPRNPRSLFGLHASLVAQGKTADAEWVQRAFDEAWTHADTKLTLDSL